MKPEQFLTPKELIEQKILLLRGKKVMLDFELAHLYQVEVKVLNQAVKRNIERFPHDAAMLSSVLRSSRAIQINIQIMRTFTKIRNLLATHTKLRKKIEEMKKHYDSQFKIVFDTLRELLPPPPPKPKGLVGFH